MFDELLGKGKQQLGGNEAEQVGWKLACRISHCDRKRNHVRR